MQDNRAFQQMLLSAKERICVHAPEEIAQKSGAVFHNCIFIRTSLILNCRA